MLEDIDLNAIPSEFLRKQMRQLLNLIEKLSADLRALREENQMLRDENNHLKGEQGKPDTKANKEKSSATSNHSSETERKEPRKRHGASKKDQIKIDRKEVAKIQKADLPADAQFKGYVEVVVQDIVVKTDNVLFRKEKYYSPSTGKTYLAELPEGYEGQFGPGLKALIPDMYFEVGASEPKILGFFKQFGLNMSKGEFSNLLIKGQDVFHAESDAVYESGLRSTSYQQSDSTLTRVNGQNQNCHVVCNRFYSVYRTLPHKDRLSVLDVLRNGRPRKFRLNQTALDCLANVQLSQATRQTLSACCSEFELDEEKFQKHLTALLPNLGHQQRKEIIDAAAIAAYWAETDWPVIEILVCDDAPNYNKLTRRMMLCWVHEGRPYKKLHPVVPLHRQLQNNFLKCFWDYYHELLAYKQSPSEAECTRLETAFGELFATQTGYEALDERIAKTRAKQKSLLLVLEYPEVPLHNNASELGVRRRVRKRDVSFGPRTEAGRRAWDTFMTLAETTRKLGLSFYTYLYDRISGANAIPPLADLIAQAADKFTLTQSCLAPTY
ncbi:MAG: transposase [Bacteroidota bacterium]